MVKERKPTNNNGKLGPTAMRVMKALLDGLPHTREELMGLVDSQATMNNVHVHLASIRKMVRAKGCDVHCRLLNKRLHYQLVATVQRQAAKKLLL